MNKGKITKSMQKLVRFRKAAYLPATETYSVLMNMRTDPELPSYPPLWFVRISQKIRLFFLRMNRRFTHPNFVMWELAQNMWLAAGISVVAELGIADLVKEGPVSIKDLADQTGTHEESLYRVMRMLASQGIFRELREQRFESNFLAVPLQEDQIRYLMLLHLNRNQFQIFGNLMKSVRTGKPVSEDLSAEALFDRRENNELKKEWFNRAMTNASKMQVPALLSAFPFRKYEKIIDIGGGEGFFLANILRRRVKSRGVLFDLPGALSGAEDIIDRFSLKGRMELVGGDFFENVPASGNLYILKSILHDWDDESSMKILGKLHEVMGPKSRLLVIESVLDERNHPSFGKMADILMMAAAGGKERTLKQWENLLSASGFSIRKIHPTITPHSIIEVLKI